MVSSSVVEGRQAVGDVEGALLIKCGKVDTPLLSDSESNSCVP